jgi:serine protease AprX
MPTFDDVAAIIARNRDAFRKPGVLSVRPGYQFAGGWITRKPCLVVSVRHKGGFAPGDALPENVEGVAVDVRQGTTRQIAAADGLPVSLRPENAEPQFAQEQALAPGLAASVPEVERATPKLQVPYSPPDGVALDRVEDVMSITCHASPDAGWPTLQAFLQGTQKGLVVGLYDFTSGHVLQTVKTSLTQSQKLTLVLDHPAPNDSRDQTDDETHDQLQASLESRLAFAWALERASPRASEWIFPSAYHIKVAVRDGRTLWLSSGNWNNSNQPDIDPIDDPAAAAPVLPRCDRDWHVVVEHPRLAAVFEAYVRHDLDVARGGQVPGPTVDGASLEALEPQEPDAQPPQKFFPPFVVHNERVAVQPILTPDNYADEVLRLIQSARKSLYLQTQYIHPSDKDGDRRFALLIEAVKQKITAGLDVRVILSQYEATGAWLEKLQDAGLDMQVVKIQSRVHNKGIIVDSSVVLIGSHNWSADGTLRNRDASLILWHEGAARYFEQIFNHDWTTLARQQVSEATPPIAAQIRRAVRTRVPDQITVNGISVDPTAQAPALLSASLIRSDAHDTDYILVQADRPLTADDRARLTGLGAEVLEIVPGNAYVCHYPPSDLGAVRALPFVKFANPYFQQFKVAPALRGLATPAAGVNILSLAPNLEVTREPQDVEVVLHRNVDVRTVRDKVARAAGVSADQLSMGRGKIRLRVEPSHLQALAALDEVRHIEEYSAPKLMNDQAAKILEHQFTYDGNDQVIGICDTGIDSAHPAFAGRIRKAYALGRTGLTDDPHGHGTHVAGSALGDAQYHPAPGTAIPLLGAAPRAAVVMQSVLGPSGGLTGLPIDLHDLFITPYQADGVRIHSNSWGTSAAGKYTQSSYEVDDFVWTHRDCIVIFAAGNDGADYDRDGRVDPQSLSAPATAKNCITVGATESNRPGVSLRYGAAWPTRFPAPPIADDYLADGPQGMAAFSSRGPTADGRIKPDVVAPGTCILSARSSQAQAVDTFGVSPDPQYMFDSGTSMATPLVAGCIAALRQALMSVANAGAPSAALAKAMIINGAMPIAGQYVPSEVPTFPNNAAGFGRVHMARTVPPYAGAAVTFWDESDPLQTGQSVTRTLAATKGLAKVTLAWTDAPGEALQNDLDLLVFDAAGREYHGNLGASAEFDRVNNVEQVEIPCTPGAEIRVVVRAYRTLQPQTFALVVRFGDPIAGAPSRGTP